MDFLASLRAFVRITETGSFVAVARETNTSQSAVSRLIAQLEQQFAVRLFHRTTRRLSLTDDGETLLAHARQVLDTVEEMDAVASGSPRGVVRLGVTVAVGLFLAPRLPILTALFPGLSVSLTTRDQPNDMIEDRLDVAIRHGVIADSSLVARQIGRLGNAVVAAPLYRERHGAPGTVDELVGHACLIHDATADSNIWHFVGPQGPTSVKVSGSLSASDSETVLRAARAGHGIARLPEIQMIDDLRAGRLFRLLEEYPSQAEPVYIVYPSRRNLAPRTRAVLDSLAVAMSDIQALLVQGEEVLT